ncbi:MAG: hypothetical protein IJD58_12530 [Lachnospiraceae bacterium]|nr:hypothetical protein [Lachnospiraceae bacterium]
MATIYYFISLASYIIALLFLVLSIVLFFKFDIIKIIGDLSGRNARKSVEAMKKRVVEKDDTSTSLGSRINSEITTEKLEDTTAKIQENDEDATVHLERDEDATVYLDKSEDATVHLEMGKTMIVQDANEQTQILDVKADEKKSGFIVEREITLVHTDTYLL